MRHFLKLIPDWRQSWKFASMRWSALGIIVMSILEAVHQGWLALPSQVAERIPNAPLVAMVIYVLVMLGRVYKLAKGRKSNGDEAGE